MSESQPEPEAAIPDLRRRLRHKLKRFRYLFFSVLWTLNSYSGLIFPTRSQYFTYLYRLIQKYLGMIFDQQDIDKLHSIIRSRERLNIVITTHRKPDGDALGSSLALLSFLRRFGHSIAVVIPTGYDRFLHWLPGTRMLLIGSTNPKPAERKFMEADLIFCLDFGGAARVESLQPYLEAAEGMKVMIDHHIDPETWPDLMFHRTGASSTCELLYKVIEQMGEERRIDTDIATCLYTGIMTDTGSFRFSSTTPETHRIAAKLLECGVDPGMIHNHIFDNFTEARTRFIGYALHEKMTVLPEYRTAYMVVTKEERERFKIQHGDTEGLVNYNLSLQGIIFGVLIVEDDDRVKLSFRSIGHFPANEVAGHFGGGGHLNAAGGRSFESVEATEKQFVDLLPLYKERLLEDEYAQ